MTDGPESRIFFQTWHMCAHSFGAFRLNTVFRHFYLITITKTLNFVTTEIIVNRINFPVYVSQPAQDNQTVNFKQALERNCLLGQRSHCLQKTKAKKKCDKVFTEAFSPVIIFLSLYIGFVVAAFF